MGEEPREPAVIEDQLRRRWLLAIERLGAEAALDDAAEAFALRFGCNASEGRAIALRAWRRLSLPVPSGNKWSVRVRALDLASVELTAQAQDGVERTPAG